MVIDLQEKRHCLCRELDCTCRHQQWLHDILSRYIRDLPLPNADASIALAKGVTVTRFDDRNGVEPSILGERRRDDLQRVSVCLFGSSTPPCQSAPVHIATACVIRESLVRHLTN